MEVKKKNRSVLRAGFTKCAKEFEQVLAAASADPQSVRVAWQMLQKKNEALEEADKGVYSLLLEDGTSEEDLLAEMDTIDAYKKRFFVLRLRHEAINEQHNGAGSPPIVDDGSAERESVAGSTVSGSTAHGKRKFKLPRIELKKFAGDLKDWLPFWAQFKKIHEDPDIDASDKISYLIQVTIPESRARQLVESFPAIQENYEKIVEALMSRFGRDDLQIEVYVRELLKLILNNAMSHGKFDLPVLYDKLETQLRALETLGITSDKCAAMLFPLIKSCLPEGLLRIWQRSATFTNGRESSEELSADSRLNGLMQFLKNEVENEQRISLASEAFGLCTINNERAAKAKPKQIDQKIPTAADLINCEISKCIFCDGSHESLNCFRAQKMSLDEKRDTLATKKACFRCLKFGHQAKKCRDRKRCVVCGKTHATIMCPCLPAHRSGQVDDTCSQNPDKTLANYASDYVFLQTVKVTLVNGSQCRKVRALIDSGSQRSYILKSTAQKLKYVPKRVEKFVHSLFGGTNTSEQKHNCYEIMSRGNDDQLFNFEVLDQSVICTEIPPVGDGPWTGELTSLGISLCDTKDTAPIELLIGADIAGRLYSGRRYILGCGLVAMETIFGWCLMGKVPIDRKNGDMAMTVLFLFMKDASVTELWKLDVLGITEPTETKNREEMALAAKELFLQTVRVDEEGRYEVRLPWLEGHPPLPTNYAVALKRLESAVKKLKDKGIFEAYDNIFNEWLEEGIIERVPLPESTSSAHYLPHRPVIKDSATTKIRPVFDASSREKSQPSLNHCLEKGLNLIELIPAILLRFREQRIGVISDIRKAFLQIGVHSEDRDFLRFLWYDDTGSIIVYRHKRVVFGVCSSPFLLGATIEFHLTECLKTGDTPGVNYSRRTIEKLMKSFYVDNCVTSVNNEVELDQFIKESKILMQNAAFDLRGWEFTCASGPTTTLSVLGLHWNPQEDTLTVGIDFIEGFKSLEGKEVTKRLILSLAQRIFDPIGFTCPVTLFPKILLQQLWEKQLGWDVPVGSDVETAFRDWAEDVSYLSKIKIPRWIHAGPLEGNRLSLHTFCDASKQAYSAVVFLRVERNDRVFVHLLAAKTRVAPLRKMTIPRLELLAATIGARLYATVKKGLELDCECFFWTDSSTVISWIRRVDVWGTFVWNRTTEIRQLTPVGSWRHLPGHLNPADLPSRGCSAKYLLESKWWEGPQWLYGPTGSWPQENFICDEEEISKERRKTLVTVMLGLSSDEWHLNHFAKYDRTVRLIAWVFRFVFNSRKRTQKRTGNLTTEEVEQAENFVLRIVQHEAFSGETDSRIQNLNPFLDKEGLLRLRTRISMRNDIEDFRHPVLLPAKHSIVHSLIFDLHKRNLHVGVQGLLSILRERYWIIGGRRTVRSVVSKCLVCKRHSAKPFVTEIPPLPLDRVRDAVVFETTRVDFAGPLYLSSGSKVWICLFICAVYRAVHLELTSSLSTSAFLQTLRRFVARRGRPKTIYSDNGTNFVGAENAFGRLNWTKITEYSSVERIKWRFNPPTAAWWGGFWERLIGVLKRLLRKVLGRASLGYEDLLTLLCECESIINSRPLTYLSNDPSDLVALTPAMFLIDQGERGMPDCDAIDGSSMCRKLVRQQKLRDDLRKRFRNEYLGQLKSLGRGNSLQDISIGEVVLVGSDNDKRLDWPMGRIVELLPGKDGKVGKFVWFGFRQRRELLRPVQRMYSLECTRPLMDVPGSVTKEVYSEEEVKGDSERNPTIGQVCDSARVLDVPSDVKRRVSDSEVRYVTQRGRKCKVPSRYIPL